ncbi:MAG: hypothetical protein KU29_06505 [Sulfurovum sp. FS06-10]|jgi:metal-responsive CopG/Arc/MetJ family transcriptional regulator|nr:MAG: hypothetical protein KU29_06505 [Sulfurovum sp. FS06-10]
MLSLVEQAKSQRKTFTLPSYIVKELEAYAVDFGKKQSQIIALALEEFLNKKKNSNKVNKRLEALDALIGIAPKGSLKDLDMDAVKVQKALNA